MNPLKLIKKYYKPGTKSYYFVVNHSKKVTQKAVKIAKKLKLTKSQIKYIRELGMVHDIGMLKIHAPGIECFGKYHYIMHGVTGGRILRKEGYPKHALSCERVNLWVGVTKQYIIKNKLPLPKRDMYPKTIEEEIVCYADKFYSKYEKYLRKEKSITIIKKRMMKFGAERMEIFDEWIKKFGK